MPSRVTHIATLTAAALTFASTHAANIYALSSGSPTVDAAVVSTLTSRGHTVVIGVQYPAFTGAIPLTGFDTVYLQANANWTSGAMPVAGQQQLVDWVTNGGRLVTSEWVAYFGFSGSNFSVLGPTLPVETIPSFTSRATETISVAFNNSSIIAGLPSSFSFPLDSYSGTETLTNARAGAVSYYSTSDSPAFTALAGWRRGAGFVYSFTSTCGPTQLADPDFARLFSNVMTAISPPCEASDFNGDGDSGTDQDIEAFFRCLAGVCCETCPPTGQDFNGDGDFGTDQDIEAFFRVLAGGGC